MHQHHGPIKHHSAPAHPKAGGTRYAPAVSRASGLGGKLLLSLLLAAAGGAFVYYTWDNLIKSLAPQPEPKKVVEAPIKDEEWQAMVESLDKASRAYSGRVGIYIKDLETGKTWNYNADRLFPSASLIKVPIMAAVFEKIKSEEAGSVKNGTGQDGSSSAPLPGEKFTLDTRIKLTRPSRVGGSGSLKWVRDGTSLSVMEIVYKMITESDNTATKMLIDHVGMAYLERAFKDLGLEHTNITPEGMSLSSYRVRRENYTTPREMASLLERIYSGELVNRESSEFMLDVLKHTKSRSRLRKGLPLGWEIGHKTGLLRKSCHDVGIVFSPRGDYVIAVLTSEAPNYTTAKNFISKVAKLTYQYYKIDTDYAGLPRAQGAG